MIPDQSESSGVTLFKQLKQVMHKMHTNRKNQQQQLKQDQMLETIKMNKMKERHSIQLQYTREELVAKTRLVEELQRQLDNQQSQHNLTMRQQFRRFSEIITEKQSQMQQLLKQLARQKSKITSLQSDLSIIQSSKQTLEQNYHKSIEMLKSQLKDITLCCEQEQLDKFMSETTYKQVLDRIQMVNGMLIEGQGKMRHCEGKCDRLRKENQQLVERNMGLEIEVERQKEVLWQRENIVEGKGKNMKWPFNEDSTFIPTRDTPKHSISNNNQLQIQNHSKISKSPSTLTNNPTPQPLTVQLRQTLSLLTKHSLKLQQFDNQLNQLNKKVTSQQEVWAEVLAVKQLNNVLKDQLNQIKQLRDCQHANQLLKDEHPKLYEFFIQKMQQVNGFCQRLQKVQLQAIRVSMMIEKMMQEGLPPAKISLSEQQIAQRENEIKSKVKKQMSERFQYEKQRTKKDTETYYSQKLTAMSEQVKQLNTEITRLKNKNQDMYKLMTDMEQQRQLELRQQEDLRKEQMIMTIQPTSKVSQAISETQLPPSKNSSSKEKVDKQLIAYLQQKSQHLQELLKSQKLKLDRYKRQIRAILQTHKIKNTKLKTTRCIECLFSLNLGEQLTRKCQKCRVELHDGDCFDEHVKGCKKKNNVKGNSNNVARNSGLQQKRRNSNQHMNIEVSQKMDYFY